MSSNHTRNPHAPEEWRSKSERRSGQIVGHFRLIEPLGSSSMSVVFKAEDLRLGRPLALKFISRPEVNEPDCDLLQEARAAAAINHPNIVTVYDVGSADGEPFIAMEYVEGETLRRRLERGPPPLLETLEITVAVARALDAAHSRGIIHRDIKSRNIMLSSGQVKVLDFGLAQQTSAPETATNDAANAVSDDAATAHSSGITGTISYMSPEQARGEKLDARTDLFSLGVVLYEMLAARHPFDGDTTLETLESILTREPPLLASFRQDVPIELEGIVRRLLAKNRDQRYGSARSLIADIEKLISNLEPKAVSSTLPGPIEGNLPRVSPAGGRAVLLARYRKVMLTAGLLIPVFLFLQGFALSKSLVGIPGAVLPGVVSGLCLLGYLMGRRAAGRFHAPPEVTGSAFRGLLPFQEADRDRFYGRATDTIATFEMIAHEAFRFGVLYGDSGSGKTSLLRAGLIPKLWEEGYVPVYCRSYRDPLAGLIEGCRRLGAPEIGETEPPEDYLRRVAESFDGTLVVILDQFEELFVNLRTRAERGPFVRFVTTCHDDPSIPVKFLFSIRSDFLYLIPQEFEGKVPEPLLSSKRYHLRDFDEDQAAEIIEQSVSRANLPFERGLSRLVAHDLAVVDRVLPSELQIVGEQLQSRRIYTTDNYRRAGGKEPLVFSYLNDVIELSGDRDTAGLVLRSLISEENTRLTLPLDEIRRRTQRGRETVERMMGLFTRSRLIREIQEDEPCYELMHEYLIELINQATGLVLDATQKANRLLRQYVSNYAVDKSTRVPIGKLVFMRRHADLRGKRDRELLRKSLRWGLVKAGAAGLLMLAGATLTAASLSIREEWESISFSDGHTAAVRQAAFSPDGRLLVSVGEDAKVIVWDFAKREVISVQTEHRGIVAGVAFSPDGRWFATGSLDGKVRVWNSIDLTSVEILSTAGGVDSVAFSPNGKLLLAPESYAAATLMNVWETGTWTRLRQFPFSGNYGNFLFLDEGRFVLGRHGTFYDSHTGLEAGRIGSTEFGGNWISASKDWSTLLNVDGLGYVTFDDRLAKKPFHVERAHHDNGRTAAFSPDGRLAVTGAEDIIVWDVASRTKIQRLEHTAIVWNASFSPEGRWLVTTHGDGAILVWDIEERRRVANLNQHGGPVRAVAFSPDGRLVASGSEDGSIIVWDASTTRKRAVLALHESRVTAAAFLPDGSGLVSCDFDGNLVYWDLEKGHPTRIRSGGPEWNSHCVAISPDQKFVATTTGVYDLPAKSIVKDFTSDPMFNNVYALAFTEDGKRLIAASPTEGIYVLETDSWNTIQRDDAKDTGYVSLDYSPRRGEIALATHFGEVLIWSLDPLERKALVGKHSARTKQVAFSPDGSEIVSVGDDNMVALWNADDHRLITTIDAHTAPVLAVAFSPDGSRIVTGEHDKSVRLHTRHRVLWGYRLD